MRMIVMLHVDSWLLRANPACTTFCNTHEHLCLKICFHAGCTFADFHGNRTFYADNNSGATISLVDSHFTGNTVSGGIIEGWSSANSVVWGWGGVVILDNCTFTDNEAFANLRAVDWSASEDPVFFSDVTMEVATDDPAGHTEGTQPLQSAQQLYSNRGLPTAQDDFLVAVQQVRCDPTMLVPRKTNMDIERVLYTI